MFITRIDRTFIKHLILSSFLVFSFTGCGSDSLSKEEKIKTYNENGLVNTKYDGYVGIWYGQSPIENEYKYKYAGGLATYSNHHSPMAVYAKEVNKTFFCYGGTNRSYNFNEKYTIGPNQLYHMVSYYDHDDKRLATPTLVLDKWTSDPHDNPVINIDNQGFIWIFSPSHGDRTTPSRILKSKNPYEIEKFYQVETGWFSYPQPHLLESGKGLLFFTSYEVGRTLKYRLFDGNKFNKERILSRIEAGHYQVSASDSKKIGTAFNYLKRPGGTNTRTNLYYVESTDGGETWETVEGEELKIPLKNVKNEALIKNYDAENTLVYILDLTYDKQGNPLILFNTSKGYRPGPSNDPRKLTLAFYKNDTWEFKGIAPTDHNYNSGNLLVDKDGIWRIVAPTQSKNKAYTTGGTINLWTSDDMGETWIKKRQIYTGSNLNDNFVKKSVNAHEDFNFFWANGSGVDFSRSNLFYSNFDGSEVKRMPFYN